MFVCEEENEGTNLNLMAGAQHEPERGRRTSCEKSQLPTSHSFFSVVHYTLLKSTVLFPATLPHRS